MPETPGEPAPDSDGKREADSEAQVDVRPRTGGLLGPILVGIAIAGVATLFGMTLLGRSITAAPIVLTAIVVVLPYLYAATTAALFGLWAFAPDRRLLPALLGLVILVAALLWFPSLVSRGQEAAGLEVRVVSWNVRRLWGGRDDGGDPVACVVQTLTDIDADVLSLQEVTARDVATLSKALDLTCEHTDYHGQRDPTDGGLAVCVHEGAWRLHSAQPSRFIPKKSWNYVTAEIAQGDRIFNLLGVHLQPYRLGMGGLAHANHVPAMQGDQSAELLRRVGRFRDPTIVAGDFNSTRDAALHVALRNPLVDAHEQGGSGTGASFHLLDWLPIRIDYVYVTDAFAVRSSRIVPKDCSDHRPIVTELVLKDTAGG